MLSEQTTHGRLKRNPPTPNTVTWYTVYLQLTNHVSYSRILSKFLYIIFLTKKTVTIQSSDVIQYCNTSDRCLLICNNPTTFRQICYFISTAISTSLNVPGILLQHSTSICMYYNTFLLILDYAQYIQDMMKCSTAFLVTFNCWKAPNTRSQKLQDCWQLWQFCTYKSACLHSVFLQYFQSKR